MTSQEMFFRERKVGKIMAALDQFLGRTATEADANDLTVESLRTVLGMAEVKSASDTTVALLVARIRERDARRSAK